MAFGTKDKGKENENAFQALATQSMGKADAAINTASQPDELEARRRAQVLALDKWESGEAGPVDVRNMPGGGVNMALFNDSLKVHDANRVGRGVGSMSGNANPNFIAARNKEDEMRRHMAASGALEQNVNDALSAKDQEMTGLYGVANARNANIAGMQEGRYENDQSRYQQYLMRPQAPNFFKQLSGSFAQTAGAGLATALI